MRSSTILAALLVLGCQSSTTKKDRTTAATVAPAPASGATPADDTPAATSADEPCSLSAAPTDVAPAKRDGLVASLETEPACVEPYAAEIYALANNWHASFLKAKDAALGGAAVRMYQLVATHTTNERDASNALFYRAELLWALAEIQRDAGEATASWKAAAEAFTRAATNSNLDDKRKKESLYAAVLGWKNAQKGDSSRATGLSMVAASRTYRETLAETDDEFWTLLFLEGRQYWQLKMFDKAAPILEKIIVSNPTHEVSNYAPNLLIDALMTSDNMAELERVVGEMLKNRPLLAKRKDLKERLRKIRHQLDRKRAEKLGADREFRICADLYAEIYARDKTMERLDEVLINGALCAANNGDKKRALKLLGELLKRFPKSSLRDVAERRRKALKRK